MGRPALYETELELSAAADGFFALCREEKRRPTITGLAYHLGFESRQSFYDYEEREEFSYIIKRLRLRVESGYEEGLSSNSCTGAIFALKNMGWKDKSELDIPGGLNINWNEQKTYEK